jgi:hypothetical protein
MSNVATHKAAVAFSAKVNNKPNVPLKIWNSVNTEKKIILFLYFGTQSLSVFVFSESNICSEIHIVRKNVSTLYRV